MSFESSIPYIDSKADTIAIVTIELLDWPDDAEFPAVLAIPVAMSDSQMCHNWAWPNQNGLQEIASMAIKQIDFEIVSNPPPWELRGVRWNVRWNRSDTIAVLPGETLMSVHQVNEMFARMRQAEERENEHYGCMNSLETRNKEYTTPCRGYDIGTGLKEPATAASR